jgi:hypothetical protein
MSAHQVSIVPLLDAFHIMYNVSLLIIKALNVLKMNVCIFLAA